MFPRGESYNISSHQEVFAKRVLRSRGRHYVRTWTRPEIFYLYVHQKRKWAEGTFCLVRIKNECMSVRVRVRVSLTLCAHNSHARARAHAHAHIAHARAHTTHLCFCTNKQTCLCRNRWKTLCGVPIDAAP